MRINSLFTVLLITGLTTSLMTAPVFAKNDKQLPPGLQKKADKGQPLPPGWQKKLAKGEKMDEEVYKQGEIVVPINSHGEITLRVDDKVVRLYKATREIIEVLK
ncbi:MAG: hypothetical protein OEZ15_10120 [Gammaproteobacteria bacterium]|nr:hypothetical protein [Gammaproteobacteria bacterium]